MNKTNYKTTDTAIISLIGKENEIVNLIIIDPSTNQKGETISIALQSDGLNTYDLDLTGYSSGVYSAVISKGSTESKAIFTVGLQTGVKEIKIQTTKQIYQPGEAILILGDTAENSIIEIIMLDPDGNKIKEKETFSNKEGRISDNSFKIPTDANSGIWKIGEKSGSHFNEVEIEVLSELNSGIQIIIEEGVEVVGIGKTIQIKLAGVTQSAEINIKTNEDIIIDTLSINPSKQGEINVSWIVPKEMEPGIYKITVKDAVTFAENTFVVP